MSYSASDFYQQVIDEACSRNLITTDEGTLLEDDAAAIVGLLRELATRRAAAAKPSADDEITGALRDLLADYESGACGEFPTQLNSADRARRALERARGPRT